ncbi:MAG: hypothetical protein KJ574_00190 [Nanoarchaeota archaeon]|nr:hypothetical protein [Nanoarchaeota archaeon]
MTLKCAKCGYEPYEGDSFCRQCGDEIETFSCECGAEVFKDDKFCHGCGSELSEEVEERTENPENTE